jgi:hypothetical protein
MSPQELQMQERREVEKKQESTIPSRVYMPTADIFEPGLDLTLEMPGVEKDNLNISIGSSVLTSKAAWTQNEGGPGIKDIMTLLSGSACRSDDRDCSCALKTTTSSSADQMPTAKTMICCLQRKAVSPV